MSPTSGGAAATEALALLRAAGDNPAVHAFPGTVIVFDADLRYQAAGGHNLTDGGLMSRAMLEGNTIFQVFPPEVVAVIEPLYRRALAGEESSWDVSYRDKIFRQRLGPLRDPAGKTVGGIGFVQDVTAASVAERALSESEMRFRLAFDNAPIPMALIGLDGRYLQVNPAMCEFTGYTAPQWLGMTMADLGHPDDLASDLAAMADLHSGQRTTYLVDKRYLTSTGAIVWGSKTATLVRRQDGSPQHFIAQIQDITDRKRHEQVLAEEHRRLRDAESIGRAGSWELDLRTDGVTWSAGLFELYGIEMDQFDGDYLTALGCIHPDDRDDINARVAACARTGQPVRGRYRVTRANDGALRWIETRGEAQYEGGRPVMIRGAIADVTDQVAAEAEITAANSFQQALFNASPDIIAVWDFGSGSIVWSNRSIPEFLGYNALDVAEMGDELAWQLVHSADRGAVRAALSAARAAPDGEVSQVDYRMMAKDGTFRWFSQRSTALRRDDRDQVTQIAGVMRDTTEEMAARSALVESQSRFHELAETIEVGFVLRNLNPSRFLYVSPGFERIFGFNPMTDQQDPVVALRRVTHPDDWPVAQSQYWGRAANGGTTRAEFRVVRPDGSVRWITATSTPVIDPDGVVRRTAATSQDITDRKFAEEAQRRAESQAEAIIVKDQLLSRLSHELRTPLNAVLGFGQLLELEDLTSAQRDAVHHILRGGRHLVGLVDDVLDITKLAGQQIDLAWETVEISAFLDDTVQLMKPEALASKVGLHYRAGAGAGLVVRADPRRLRQVLLNLLSNAIKYNRAGGRVEITCESSKSSLQIKVSDTGRGIRTRDLSRLFTPFERLDAPAAGIEGTGLGLALSRDLISAMGGTLLVTSTEGVGSTFTVSLPLAARELLPPLQ